MIIQKRNRQKIWYATYRTATVQTDQYGNEIGELKVEYYDPVSMEANVSPVTGQVLDERFGNIASYDRVIVTHDMRCNINENAILFIDVDPRSDRNGNWNYDYIVRRVSKSLNSISIAVSKVSTRIDEDPVST